MKRLSFCSHICNILHSSLEKYFNISIVIYVTWIDVGTRNGVEVDKKK